MENPRSVDFSSSPSTSYGGAGTLLQSRKSMFQLSPDTTSFTLALILIPVFIAIYGMISSVIKERLYAGEAIIAMLWGMILSPYVTSLFNPRGWVTEANFNYLTLYLTRVVIALSVFAVGVELPRAYMYRHWRSLLVMLGPVMLAGWLISTVFIYLLIPPLGFLHSMVVAAALSPTDPILAASVVGKGKFAQENVPHHIRDLLQSESGCNDGAAFPFLYFALFMLLRDSEAINISSSVLGTLGKWSYLIILYQIVLGTIIGALIGITARKTLKFSKKHQLIDRESMVAMYVSLSLFTTGITLLAGSDELLAAFACGAAFAWDGWFTQSIQDSNFSSILDLLANCTIFIFIGATTPFDDWNSETLQITPWRLVLLGLAILTLRRLPSIVLLYKFTPDIRNIQEALFCGHFGPMGVGAIFIATLAKQRLPSPNFPPQTELDYLFLSIQPIVYFLVMCSILIHGLSIPMFLLGKSLVKKKEIIMSPMAGLGIRQRGRRRKKIHTSTKFKPNDIDYFIELPTYSRSPSVSGDSTPVSCNNLGELQHQRYQSYNLHQSRMSENAATDVWYDCNSGFEIKKDKDGGFKHDM